MTEQKPEISDEAVKAATGKDWAAWFEVLDAAGAQALSHKAIVAYLSDHHQVGPWWRQMVTVTYEQGRGLREKHEQSSGFQISRTKTFDVPVEELFRAWKDADQRLKWLPDPGFKIRKETPNKSLRITWVDGSSSLDVGFTGKGPGKSQVAIGHNKLKDAGQAEAMKAYWGEALEKLGHLLNR